MTTLPKCSETFASEATGRFAESKSSLNSFRVADGFLQLLARSSPLANLWKWLRLEEGDWGDPFGHDARCRVILKCSHTDRGSMEGGAPTWLWLSPPCGFSNNVPDIAFPFCSKAPVGRENNTSTQLPSRLPTGSILSSFRGLSTAWFK
jgi:hypothetical protein